MSCDSFPKLEMLVEKQCTESQMPTYNHYYEGTKKRSISKIVGDRAIWGGGLNVSTFTILHSLSHSHPIKLLTWVPPHPRIRQLSAIP